MGNGTRPETPGGPGASSVATSSTSPRLQGISLDLYLTLVDAERSLGLCSAHLRECRETASQIAPVPEPVVVRELDVATALVLVLGALATGLGLGAVLAR